MDIDAGAVEIAKLRLWLSLVIDEDETKQIKPLPNLDYKVMVGDSLLGFPFKSHGMKAVEKLKFQFFGETDHKQKARLKADIDALMSQCFADSKQSLGYEVRFDFRVAFSEIFDSKGGFDVVLGNPPFVDAHRQVKDDEKYRTLLTSLYATARGPWDLYIVFWEKSLNSLILRLVTTMRRLSDCCSVEEAFAVSEAYDLRASVRELSSTSAEHFRLITTGTIDPYLTLWGKRKTTYLKSKFEEPIILKTEFKRRFERRFQQMSSPKIIISGMRHFEAFFDAKGEYVAGISTVLLRDFHDAYPPYFLLGLLNSRLVSFYLRECYASVSMDGGINFTRPIVSGIPIPQIDQSKLAQIVEHAKAICKEKRRSPNADLTSSEQQIDDLVYELYGLTPAEIELVDSTSRRPAKRESVAEDAL